MLSNILLRHKTSFTLFLLIGISNSMQSQAATMKLLWGNIENNRSILTKFSLMQSDETRGLKLPKDFSKTPNSYNTLILVTGELDDLKISHSRYAQYYHEIPVWGYQVIYHVLENKNTSVTGMLIDNIERDLADLNGKVSVKEAKITAVGLNKQPDKIMTQKIIYFNQDISEKALLAYYVTYLDKKVNGPSMPSYIIDANSGSIIRQWDALQRAEVGKGPGGVTFNNLAYRPGQYQFGSLQSGVNAFGPFDVKIQDGKCTLANNLIKVINLTNQSENQLPFQLPISTVDELNFGVSAFSYNCINPNFINDTDGGFSPVNGGLSPINDVTYFIYNNFKMYTNNYGVASPLGGNLPLRLFTHLDDYDNAFAASEKNMAAVGIIGPNQLVFGNGASLFAPLTSAEIAAHEFGHLVTSNFSNLIYDLQSGGINESFSDMAGMTFNSYLSTHGYSWYWNVVNNDWTIGKSISKSGMALRYMNNPPMDGHSIDNAAYFTPGMDVHFSSGIFNKAFYLLSVTHGWSISKAFEIMLDANRTYWIPATNFNYAACGAIQSAYNRGYNYQDVINAFQQVGVQCLIGEAAFVN